MIDKILRLNFFIQWLFLSSLSRFLAGSYPDLAFQVEVAAMGNFMLFQNLEMLPPELKRRLAFQIKIGLIVVLGVTCSRIIAKLTQGF